MDTKVFKLKVYLDSPFSSDVKPYHSDNGKIIANFNRIDEILPNMWLHIDHEDADVTYFDFVDPFCFKISCTLDTISIDVVIDIDKNIGKTDKYKWQERLVQYNGKDYTSFMLARFDMEDDIKQYIVDVRNKEKLDATS